MINLMTEELQLIIKESREVAIRFRHGFIHYEHLFVAMLNTDCLAKKYLNNCDIDDYNKLLTRLLPIDENIEKNAELPLTVHAERIIKHCSEIALRIVENRASSIHLLLAIISYNNPIAKLLKKSGLIFSDIIKEEFTIQIEKFHPEITLVPHRPYSKFEKLFLSQSDRNKKTEKLHQQALDLFEFAEYDICINICDFGLSISPSYEAFKILIAYSYLEKREFQKALVHLSKLSEEYPDNNDYPISIAYIYDETGEHSKAFEILNATLKKLPDNEIVLNNIAFNLCYQGNFAESIAYYEKALTIKPDFAYAWDNLGFAKFKLGYTDEALSLIEKSLKFDQGNSYAYKYKGLIFMEQKNIVEAMKNFNLALRYDYTKKYGDEVLNLVKQLSH